MKRNYLAIIGIVLLTACSSDKDQAFCDCLSAGDKLNEFQQKFMREIPDTEEQQELKTLRDKKKEACKDYETLDGETMRAKKAACEE